MTQAPSGPPPRATPPPPRTPLDNGMWNPRVPRPLIPRVLLYGPEKWGKTTFCAYAPSPLILMAKGEDGYDTLLASGLVPAVPATNVLTWASLLAILDGLLADPHGIKTLCMDALGSFERLCHEHICNTEFKGDWGETGFMAYMRGYEVSVPHWIGMLAKLDALRSKHGVTVVILGHTRIKSVNSPADPAYDRYEPDSHPKTWGATSRWADAILMGRFDTEVVGAKPGAKGKAVGGTKRFVYATGRNAYVAGNRLGIPDVIALPPEPESAWSAVMSTINTTREKAQ